MEVAPLVSILMPAFNAEKYIKQAIDSVLEQTWENWELLVCNDCSTDKTSSIVSSYEDSRIKLFSNDFNIGYLKTCNKLFELSSGDFITFQDADDYSASDRIQKLMVSFHDLPEVKMVGSYAIIVDEFGAFIRNDERRLSHASIIQNLSAQSQFNGATVMVRREVLKIVGGYREYFNDFAYQDYDWTYRIAERFISINIPEYLYYYRQQPSSNSKKISSRRAISHQLVTWLAQNRIVNQNDYLDRGEISAVDKFVELKLRPYHDEPSLMYREFAANFMYNRLFRKAIEASAIAIKVQPFKLVNYRTLFYCIRKSLLS